VDVIEHQLEISRPLDEVFAFVANPLNDPQWCPRVRTCHQRVGEELAPGARYLAFHHPTLQRPHERIIDIVALEPPRRIVSEQKDNVGHFTITYLLEPTGTGTRLTQRDEIEWKVLRPFHFVGRRIVGRHIVAQLDNLKGLLEGEPMSGRDQASSRPPALKQ
jgi:uncharacterized protein YndB with AHSA1/START domain